MLLAHVLSFGEHDSKWFCFLSAVAPNVRNILANNAAWQHLCKEHWYATEDRLKEWPSLSACGLYSALETWVPCEGYYVLATAFPWGLLVLVRLTEGRVAADIIRFHMQSQMHKLEDVLIPFFRVNLFETQPGKVQSAVEPSWCVRHGDQLEFAKIHPSRLRALPELGGHFSFHVSDVYGALLLNTTRAFRVSASVPTASSETPAPTGSSLTGGHQDISEWQPQDLPKSVEVLTQRTQHMLDGIFGSCEVPVDCALVRSPADFVPQNAEFPGIRPGLYVGDYGHLMYGQYRTEVLLLEYISLTPEEVQRELESPTRIFSRPQCCGSTGPPEELQMLANLQETITFVRGIKQCGDKHVPMGATTFVAICGPETACESLADSRHGAPRAAPREVRNRGSGQSEVVMKSWCGFGTLAGIGFQFPSWAPGWLVQLPDDPETQDHRFAFMWSRNQDAVVLQWIRTQDTCPFLQRAWLPRDLQ